MKEIRFGKGFALQHKDGWISNYCFHAMHEAEDFRKQQMYPDCYKIVSVRVSRVFNKLTKGQVLDGVGAIARYKYAVEYLKGKKKRAVINNSMRYFAEAHGIDFDEVTYEEEE